MEVISASEKFVVRRNNKNDLIKALVIYGIAFFVIFLSTVLKYVLVSKLRPANPALTYGSIALCMALVLSTFIIYVFNSRKSLLSKSKELAAIITAVTITYVSSIYLSIVNIYLMPVALTSFIVAPLSRKRDAFLSNIFANVLVLIGIMFELFLSGGSQLYPAIVMFILGVTAGTLVSYNVSNDTRRLNYIVKGCIIAVLSVLFMVVLAYIQNISTEYLKILPYFAISTGAQILLGLMFLPVFEKIFNLITNSRLVEFTDHNSPLIKKLMSEAPGTFNHSLAVANFAEVCASAIGENPYLARACAYYHDIGKLVNPQYFKENQSGFNPHDEVLPEVSAEIIRGHTTEGLSLCEEYRIPEEISHVTVQHHGTLPIAIFYNKAKQLTDGEVDISDYSYHGITPITKVAAVIMICDSSEAAIRAMDKPDGERVDKLLKSLISARIDSGQFDNCDITLRDLDTIRRTIINAYGGLFHERIQYPDGKTSSKF